jgi:hypothetical protein
MFEKDYIQQNGFRNIARDGKIYGFQVPLRTQYYRGVWLSQLRPAILTVDGVKYENDQLTWTVGGKEYEQKDFPTLNEVYWQHDELAILTAKLPGGLKPGVHEVEFSYTYTICYMAMADLPWSTYKRTMVLVE